MSLPFMTIVGLRLESFNEEWDVSRRNPRKKANPQFSLTEVMSFLQMEGLGLYFAKTKMFFLLNIPYEKYVTRLFSISLNFKHPANSEVISGSEKSFITCHGFFKAIIY